MRGIERIFAILTSLGAQPGQALSDVADRIELPRPTVLRFLRSLQDDGWVSRDEEGRYSLGPAIVALASQYISSDALLVSITPTMRELRDELGETISLCRVSGSRRLCVQEFPSEADLRLVLGLGAYGPLHAGASGLVLLAHMPAAARDAIVRSQREYYTSRTIQDDDALLAECERIRERGWSITAGQRTAGGVAAAIAVRDPGAPFGVSALGVYGPDARSREKEPERWIDLLKAAADKVESAI